MTWGASPAQCRGREHWGIWLWNRFISGPVHGRKRTARDLASLRIAGLTSKVITGAVSRLAKQIGVSTPLLDYTYALMRGLQVELLEQIEAKKAKI